MGQGCKYANQKAICDFHVLAMVFIAICQHFRDIQLKCACAWPRPLQWAKIKCKYANWNTIIDVLFVGNSNVCPVCHNFRDIHNKNVHNFDLYYEPRSNVNIPVEEPHAVLAITMFVLSVTIYEIIMYEHIAIVLDSNL